MPFEPFFPKSEIIKLGERFSSSIYFFGAGERVAINQANNLFHFDINKGNCIVTPWGESILIDWEHVNGAPENPQINPETSAATLIAPFLNFDNQEFHSFLSGYITQSIIRLDNKYENLTNELLQIIGGTYLNVPKLRPVSIDLAKYFRLLNLQLSFSNEKKIICKSASFEGKKELWENEPQIVLILATYMILAGISPQKILLDEAVANKLSDHSKILHNILNGYFTHKLERINSVGSMASVANIVINNLVSRLNYPFPDSTRFTTPPLQQPDHLALTIMHQSAKSLPSQIYEAFVDGFTDFTNYLAHWLDLDRDSAFYDEHISKSFDYAQIAYLLLRYDTQEFEQNEMQLSRILYDHNSLSWNKFRGCDYMGENDDKWIIQRMIFMNNLSNTYKRLYEKALGSNIFLYSLLRQMIKYRRVSVRFAAQIILDKNSIPNESEDILSLFPSLVGGLAYALRLHLEKAQEVNDKILSYPWINEKRPLGKEFEWALETMDFLKNNNLMTPKGKEKLIQFESIQKIY